MNEIEDRFFTVTNSKNKTIEYEILFTFDSEETKKSYIIFTDNKKDDNGDIITYAATYDKKGKDLKLNNIETEQEWNLIESLLSGIEDKINEE